MPRSAASKRSRLRTSVSPASTTTAALRCGFPEVIFGLGKTPEQIEEIFVRLAAAGGSVLGTRIPPDAAERVQRRFPAAQYHTLSRTLTLRRDEEPESMANAAAASNPKSRIQNPKSQPGFVGVVCAGTADLPVAEEARITAEIMGCDTESFTDVGRRRPAPIARAVRRARGRRVLIVVAGMEAHCRAWSAAWSTCR